MPDLSFGLYNGRNPHSFADSTGELWDYFWHNYSFIGKSYFYKNRFEYNNCYWDNLIYETSGLSSKEQIMMTSTLIKTTTSLGEKQT